MLSPPLTNSRGRGSALHRVSQLMNGRAGFKEGSPCTNHMPLRIAFLSEPPSLVDIGKRYPSYSVWCLVSERPFLPCLPLFVSSLWKDPSESRSFQLHRAGHRTRRAPSPSLPCGCLHSLPCAHALTQQEPSPAGAHSLLDVTPVQSLSCWVNVRKWEK